MALGAGVSISCMLLLLLLPQVEQAVSGVSASVAAASSKISQQVAAASIEEAAVSK